MRSVAWTFVNIFNYCGCNLDNLIKSYLFKKQRGKYVSTGGKKGKKLLLWLLM